jgi:hypothetical protein
MRPCAPSSTGADPAAIGVIAGAAVPLAFALTETWQVAVLAADVREAAPPEGSRAL